MFVADDELRVELLRERASLGEDVMLLAGVAWDRAEEPGWTWVYGMHVSSQAPALAAVLLGDVEGEDGAQGGVALSPQAVGALVLGMATALARPSTTGSFLWPVSRERALSCTRGMQRSPCQRVPLLFESYSRSRLW